MLKMALLDCAINEKCCSFDGRLGYLTAQESPPPGICHCLGVSRKGGGGGWAQLELTDV